VSQTEVRRIGRYILFQEIAAGGMAAVHYGRLLGEGGFSRTVAVKRLHAHLAKDADFASLFLDEARLAARIEHPNVVKTLDIVRSDGELMIVMEYVVGEPLSKLIRVQRAQGLEVPIDIVMAIMIDALHGLDAAHDATDEKGVALEIVHRDVSPQNLLVGKDGSTRVLDFGIAKAAGRSQTTQDGQIKGKLAYMAPEQLTGTDIDRRADIYAAGILLWELLTGHRLFVGENEGMTITNVLHRPVEPPSRLAPGVHPAFDTVVLTALNRDRSQRYPSARAMAAALEAIAPPASTRKVAEWVQRAAGETLAERARILAKLDATPTAHHAVALSDALAALPKASQVRRFPRGFVIGAAVVGAVLAGSTMVVCGLRGQARVQEFESGRVVAVAVAAQPVALQPSSETVLALSPEPSSSGANVVVVAPSTASVGQNAHHAPTAETPPARPPIAKRLVPSHPTQAATVVPAPSSVCKVQSYIDKDGLTQFRKVCP
jgi:eukaryotic-like serine/threonine-protein kinase